MTTPERTTEPAADVCPKCGANKTDPTTFDGYYDCSSFQFPAAWENKFTQSDTCRIRELESQVAKLHGERERATIALAKALQIIDHAGNMDGDVETVKRYLRNGMRSLDPTQPKTENRP